VSDVLKCKADIKVANNAGILEVAKRPKVNAAPGVELAVVVTAQLNVTEVEGKGHHWHHTLEKQK